MGNLPANNLQRFAKLDGLLGHLSLCSGLYSKETFLSLYSCVTRMLRDQRMQGFALTRTLGDHDFDTLAFALDGLDGLPVFRLEGDNGLSEEAGILDQTGFLIILADRLCAAMYWCADKRKTFRMFEGGWTFHPADTKTIATHLIGHLQAHPDHPTMQALLDGTVVDRRYDDKLNALITSLVNGLESRNRELINALEQVNDLNHKMVESERLAAIGQLCSVIAHEIRNPLGLIDLYAKLVEGQVEKMMAASEEGSDKSALLNNLQQIRTATVNLEGILSELTSYSRPMTLEKQRLNLADVVRDICGFYAPYYAEKQVGLNYPPEDASPLFAEIDAGKFRQALINLLKNALEASPAGSEVSVALASRKKDKNVYIKVEDQGAGVEPRIAEKLFTPYFSTKGNGTGLGLAHSRKILQAHGGSVELLKSTLGEGSTFALILPKIASDMP